MFEIGSTPTVHNVRSPVAIRSKNAHAVDIAEGPSLTLPGHWPPEAPDCTLADPLGYLICWPKDDRVDLSSARCDMTR